MARRGTTASIEMDQLEKLCAMQATDEEIAAWFNVSTRTIERRRKQAKFGDVMDRGKARGRLSIRRAQIKLLESGNATMAIWLGKQYLGQTDQLHHEVSGVQIQIVCPAGSLPPSLPAEDGGVIIDIGPGDYRECRELPARTPQFGTAAPE